MKYATKKLTTKTQEKESTKLNFLFVFSRFSAFVEKNILIAAQ